MRWAYGIITVRERATTLLPDTIESLAAAGFDQPALFVDGPEGSQLDNWRRALRSLVTDDPNASRYAVFEDDLIACLNLRCYLEAFDFPERGYWNLLTHEGVLMTDAAGWQKSTQRGKGAVGLVFDRAAVDVLLNCKDFWRFDSQGGRKGADGLIVRTMRAHRFSEYIHNPGLIQHTGTLSAIRERVPRHPTYGRMKSFVGADFNAMELLPF